MNAVGLNWSAIKDRKIKELQDKVDKLYRENQRMKRRLIKYEKTRAMVNYYNKKGKNEDDNSRTTRNRKDNYFINPS
jgi:acyl-[acyl carrier protein]--UDP-N-acetylglucosamine O-acyltransferase